MKKIIGFAVTVFTVATLFAAARPSLDGRALVADSGTMPKGLFARTIGYLPGDSVAVTNPATGSTVDVLILGAIDPSEGVAILLSPEAAEKLNIKQDSNVQVKITKRAGSLDEAVSGTAVLAESDEPYDDDTDDQPSLALSETIDDPIEEISGTEPTDSAETTAPAVIAALTEPEADEPIAEAVPVVSETEDETDTLTEYAPIVAETEPLDEEPVTIKSLLETPTEPVTETVLAEPLPEETSDTPEPYAPTEVAEIVPAPVEAAETVPAATDEPLTDRIVFIEKPGDPAGDAVTASDGDVSDAYLDELAALIKPSVSEDDRTDETPSELFDENAPTVAESEVIEALDDIPALVESDASEKVAFDDATDLSDDEPVAVAEADGEEETDATDIVYVERTDDELAFAPEADGPTEEKSFSLDDVPAPEASVVAEVPPESADGAYQPIILVPADENPPIAEDTDTAEDYLTLEPVAVVASVTPAEVPLTVVPAASVAPAAPTTDDYLVPTLADLQSGKYYVQIASLGDKENIDALLAKYAETYPMAVVPLKSGRAYQVMVGPLGTDEYTTIQEKFRAYGFKDAFLRKIR